MYISAVFLLVPAVILPSRNAIKQQYGSSIMEFFYVEVHNWAVGDLIILGRVVGVLGTGTVLDCFVECTHDRSLNEMLSL